MIPSPNHPATGKVEIASWLTFKGQWRDLPEPGRYAASRTA